MIKSFTVIAAAIASALLLRPTFAAELTVVGTGDNRACYVKGELKQADFAKFLSVCSNCNQVMLDSPGGDLQAAMKIGRKMREQQVSTTVPIGGQCASACVFLYVAGVTRANYGPVKIHRPYLVADDASSFASTQRKFDSLGREARKYLREMNVRESLFDAMLKIPPESSSRLSLDELQNFGAGPYDPVYAEYLDNLAAKRMELSKRAYLEVKSRVGKICGPMAPLMPIESYECWKREAPGSFAE